MGTCPFHPAPLKNKASLLMTFFKKRRSWLDGLYERSYAMKMGRVRMPGVDLHVINESALVHRVMVEEVSEFPKSELLGRLLEPLLGESIFTTNGAQWKKQREMLNPSFDMVRVSRVFGLMREAADDMLVRLSKHENGAVVEMDAEMTYVTADIIFRTILSSRLDERDARELIEAFVTFQEETARTAMRTMFRIPEFLWMFTGEKRRIKAGNRIRDVLSSMIRPRYDAVQRGEPGGYSDILSSLLQAVDADTGERFSFEEILDQVAMLFLAGHETSASALTWSLYLLAISPEQQERAFEEVRSVCGDAPFEAAMMKQLPFVTNVFKEALRLYPPVGFFARESAHETTMREKTIPEGASVVVAPWLIHRHKEYWEKPHEFDPDRHSDPKLIAKETYLPFGMGPRICIGAGFAMQEAVLLLASLLRTYRFELQEGFVPDVVGRLTIRSANGMPIVLHRRVRP